jgi:hypothetical protein
MAFTGNFACNTLKAGFNDGTINFATDTFYLALYTNSATLDASTTAYTPTGEATGGNYAPGGLPVTAIIGGPYVNFTSPSWTGVITARGALIYKAGSNVAICVLDFGSDKTSVTTYTVQMPATGSTSSLIRFI